MAALDGWLVASCAELLDGRGAIVDVGYGQTPVTTLELARAVRAVNSSLRVVGIEAVPASAQQAEVELITGDFSTCARLGPTAVVRAMNVLRGYREDEVPAIHEALGAALVEGGLVLEGSTDTEGHVMVAHLLRRRGIRLVREALLFHTDFTRGFSPWLFRDWLPRDLRRSARPGTPIHALLTRWDEYASSGPGDPRERFIASVRIGVEATPWELEHGFARSVCPV